MNEVEENIMNKLNELLANDLKAINVNIFGNSASKSIQIMIESDLGVSIDHCSKVTKLAQNIIALEKYIDDNYSIEVSSPGINRPLYNKNDFVKYQGEKVFIELKKNISNQKRFKGYYEVIGNTICISHKKEKVVITFDDIKKANLVREIKI
jgi:ribosome maturation factor RimP